MTTTIKSRQAAAILALNVMKELVSINYSEPISVQPDSQPISENEEEIISYISGYLLRKFSHTQEAQVLTASPSRGLIKLMDRGGLTYANEGFISIVRELEVVFRQMPKISANLEIFDSAVCEQNIPSHFFPLLDSVDSPAQEKELFFTDIMHVFFTVRAHQKCRQLVENCILSTKKSRNAKALRDSI